MAKERKYPDRYIFKITTEANEVRIERVLAKWSGFGVYKAGRWMTLSPKEVEARTSLRYVLGIELDLERSALRHSVKVAAHNTDEYYKIYNALKAAGLSDAFDLAHRFDCRDKDDEEVQEITNRIATMEAMLAAMQPTVAAETVVTP